MPFRDLSLMRLITTRRLLLLAAVAAVGLTAAARAGRLTATEEVPGAAPQGGAEGRLRVVRLALRPSGFDPAELIVRQGRALLAVDNISGLDDISLTLRRETGGGAYEAGVRRGAVKWRQVLKLTPGTYLLGEAGRPDWVCRITVTPN